MDSGPVDGEMSTNDSKQVNNDTISSENYNNNNAGKLGKHDTLEDDQPTFDTSYYNEVMNSRKNENHFKKHLRTQYPIQFIIWHCVALILLSCGMIAMQVILIIQNGFLSYIGAGIFNGIIFVILAILLFVLNKTRNYYLYRVIYVMHILATLISIVTLFLLPLIASNISSEESPGGKLIDDYYAAMIIFSIMCDASCMLFLCIMNCAINRPSSFNKPVNQSSITYNENIRSFFSKKTFTTSKKKEKKEKKEKKTSQL